MQAKPISASETTATQLVMPNDTNPLGSLMGGNLMRWMDITGGICAARHCEAHVVTASVDHISFHKPIRLGDVVTIKACVTRAFRTSVEVFIEVFTGDVIGTRNNLANHAFFTFVGLDQNTQKPTPVPQVITENQGQKEMYEAALRRRELRLILSGRMQTRDATELKALFQDIDAEGGF